METIQILPAPAACTYLATGSLACMPASHEESFQDSKDQVQSTSLCPAKPVAYLSAYPTKSLNATCAPINTDLASVFGTILTNVGQISCKTDPKTPFAAGARSLVKFSGSAFPSSFVITEKSAADVNENTYIKIAKKTAFNLAVFYTVGFDYTNGTFSSYMRISQCFYTENNIVTIKAKDLNELIYNKTIGSDPMIVSIAFNNANYEQQKPYHSVTINYAQDLIAATMVFPFPMTLTKSILALSPLKTDIFSFDATYAQQIPTGKWEWANMSATAYDLYTEPRGSPRLSKSDHPTTRTNNIIKTSPSDHFILINAPTMSGWWTKASIAPVGYTIFAVIKPSSVQYASIFSMGNISLMLDSTGAYSTWIASRRAIIRNAVSYKPNVWQVVCFRIALKPVASGSGQILQTVFDNNCSWSNTAGIDIKGDKELLTLLTPAEPGNIAGSMGAFSGELAQVQAFKSAFSDDNARGHVKALSERWNIPHTMKVSSTGQVTCI